MDTIVKKFEIAAYAAVVIMALVTTGTSLARYFKRPPDRRPPLDVSQHTALQGIDWSSNKNTLLLALSVNCNVCRDSMKFYQKLATDSILRRNVHIIAVFPQSTPEAQAFLSTYGLGETDVRQAQLAPLVPLTPTLILVDDQGHATESWSGMLDEKGEAALLSRLQGLNSGQ